MTILYILLAILIFGVLIGIHELGHFLAAKACGVKVNEFSIGMGPALWKKQKGETLYALRAIPLGGYCAMAGEDEASDDPRAFTNQVPWKRIIILCAGALMNFLLGLAVVLLIYSSADYFRTPTLSGFMEGCPYEGEQALMVGDEFYKIDGHRIYMYYDVADFLGRGGDSYDLVLIRDGKKLVLDDFYMPAVEYPEAEKKMIGIYIGGTVEATLGTTLKYGWNTTMEFGRMVWMSLGMLIHGEAGIKDLSGPVGIVELMAETGEQSASLGDAISNILYLGAFIAVNLAVMNMLPIPALDGGRVFLLLVTWLIETATRKKLDPKYEAYIHGAGMVLLLALMAFVLLNDVIKLFR